MGFCRNRCSVRAWTRIVPQESSPVNGWGRGRTGQGGEDESQRSLTKLQQPGQELRNKWCPPEVPCFRLKCLGLYTPTFISPQRWDTLVRACPWEKEVSASEA